MLAEAVKKLKVLQLFHVEQYSSMMKMSLQADLTGDQDTCKQAGLAANQHAGYTQLLIDVISELDSLPKEEQESVPEVVPVQTPISNTQPDTNQEPVS